jgi:SAM-dependent methyltransferase
MKTEPTATTAPCPLCGRPAAVSFGGQDWLLREGGRRFHYEECNRCGLRFSVPMPDDDETAWLYTGRYDYAWFARRSGLKKIQAWHRSLRIRSLLRASGQMPRGTRLLDVGCGHGWFVDAARRRGWQAEGIDLSESDSLSDAPIHQGSLVSNDLPRGSFDVITIWHGLEHMNNPRESLAGLANLLAPGGVCLIALPNLDSTAYRRDQQDWVWCQKPFIHPWHFSSKSLQAMLPPGLDPVRLTARDTWDGQWATATPIYRRLRRVIEICTHASQKIARLLHLRRAVEFFETLQFLAEETLRLTAYAIYLALRPLLRARYEDGLKACELTLIARKAPAEQSARSGLRDPDPVEFLRKSSI